MSAPTCRKCTVPMRTGFAIAPALMDLGEGTISEGSWLGVAPIVDVWKYAKCGHSFAIGPVEVAV